MCLKVESILAGIFKFATIFLCFLVFFTVLWLIFFGNRHLSLKIRQLYSRKCYFKNKVATMAATIKTTIITATNQACVEAAFGGT